MEISNELQPRKASYKHPSVFPVIDGVIHVPGVTEEYLQDIKKLPLKEVDEVFVATYIKAGTTWVSEITWQIYTEGIVTKDRKTITKRVPFLELLKFEEKVTTKQELYDLYNDHPSPRIFKTHLRYHQVPLGDGTTPKPKYIYVIRNPKDSAVSLYHHMRSFSISEFSDGTWDEFFEMFIKGEVMYDCWFDHVLGWWAHRNEPNILVLKYEDMKKELPSAVQQIAKFVGKDLSPEIIQRIAQQTTFTAMSNDKGQFWDDEEATAMRVAGAGKFLRKGEIGDWRNYFTEEQHRRFDELYEKRMAGSGLELEFD